MKKNPQYYLFALIGLAFTLGMTGCSKENSPSADNVAKVQVVLGGIDNKDIATLKASKEESATSNSNVQIKNVKLGENLYLQASLSKVGGSQSNSSSDIALKASSSGTKAVVNDVIAGVKYKVMVFDTQGAYVDEAEYTAGGSNTQQFTLIPNKEYSFICYSLNGTDPLPWISNVGSSLADATLGLTMAWTQTSGNDDLLYTRIDKTVVAGMNVLDILFRHKFTEITTKVDASAIGSVAGAEFYFGEVYRRIDLNLEDGSLTYKNPTSRQMVFPTLNTPVVTSLPMTIARPGFNGPNPYPGSAVIRKIFGNLKIGNVEKYFEVPELAVEPGERYSLDIIVKTSPDQVAGLVWAPGNLKYDGASYAFSYTNGLGSYFPFNHLYPYGDERAYSDEPWDVGDPCTGVVDGYTWRTPTQADFNALAALGPVENKTIGGLQGTWYATSATKGVFFPAAGYKDNQNSASNPLSAANEGWYWSHTQDGQLTDGSGGGIFALHMGATNSGGLRSVQVERRAMNTLPAGTNDYVRSRSTQIRCVRNL